MPASAAVPIDPGISVTASVKEHPEPLAVVDADHVASSNSPFTLVWSATEAAPL
jgi:hypothetical protein